MCFPIRWIVYVDVAGIDANLIQEKNIIPWLEKYG
jgi:hypothetical protein